MAVITDLYLPPDADDVARACGPRRGRVTPPGIRRCTSSVLSQMSEERWLAPAISYQIHPITDRATDWMELSGRIRLSSPLLMHRLRRASSVVFGVCTIGPKLSQQASAWFAERERLKAVILDDIGTTVLFKLGDHLEALISKQSSAMGLEASGPSSPGEEGFDVTAQAQVLELAGGSDIGVVVKGGGLLVPHKSMTSVIGLGEKMTRWSRGDTCAACSASERCPYRHGSVEGGTAA